MLNVFAFLEYRDFLKAHFEEQKENKSFFSFRYIASKTGIDPSYYAKILNKQKHIGQNKVEELIQFLDLHGKEKEYFSILISFNKTTDEKSEQELFAKLVTLKNSSGKELSDSRYFDNWRSIPIREMLNVFSFDNNYEEFGQKFSPEYSAEEVKTSIKLLKKLGLISKDKNGILRPCDIILTNKDQWRDYSVRLFQKKMIELAGEAIERFEPKHRNISSVTVSTSKKCLEAINERLAQARHEILELIAAEKEVDGVYQINLQVFPLTKCIAQKGEIK